MTTSVANQLTVFKALNHITSADDLDVILTCLSKFGRPNLYNYKDGTWSCGVDMFVTAKGVSFEVKSDNDIGSPKLAAMQCVERIKAAFAGLDEVRNDK